MERIRGRQSLELDVNEFTKRLANRKQIILDLGTGDGRYARDLASKHPDWFVIGVDSCRENLREHSQAKLQNILFLIASAQDLPQELNGLVSQVTINFPWGSLLQSLLVGDAMLLRGLERISNAAASMELRLNGGALTEAGKTLEAGGHTIHNNLLRSGWRARAPVMIDGEALRNFPSTWAKRLAFGRDPRAMMLSAHK